MTRARIQWGLISTACIVGTFALRADDAASKSLAKPAVPAVAAAAKTPAVEIPEEETIAFAREHHPELADLLVNLKSTKPQAYARGLKQLSAAHQRLSRIKTAFPEKYALGLAVWKLDSRIQLLAARMTMSDETSLEEELKKLLAERHEARVKELTYDRELVEARLKKVDEALQKTIEGRDQALAAELDKIMKVRTQKRAEAADRAAKIKKAKQKKTGAVSGP